MAAPAEPAPSKIALKVARLRARYEWLDHLARAGARYTERHGDHYAAAVTFFSVLSLVPLIMIAFATAGYVLYFNPELLGVLRDQIKDNLPESMAPTLIPIVDQAIAQRGTVGLVGLVGALYAGIGWMTNLREALTEQWAQAPQAPPMLKRLLLDLLALVGLGLALVLSFGITAIAAGFAADVLEFLGLAGQGWARALLGLIGLLLGLTSSFLVFLWVIARLPRRRTSWRGAVKGAVLGAVGFEILKRAMTYYLGGVTNSPSGAVFGSLLGLLVFVFIASRFTLFVTAWAATARENESAQVAAVPAPVVIRQEVVMAAGPDGRTAAGLVGAGVVTGVLGLLGVRLLSGRR